MSVRSDRQENEAAERESQEQPDDRTADSSRLGAPDVRMGGRGLGAEVIRIKN